jgi:hypothetical protein
MSSLSDRNEGLRLLQGLENGTMNASDAYNIAKDREPILLYFILRYLRDRYNGSDPASAGVMRRVIELTGTYDQIVRMNKEGEKDAMVEWFNDGYSVSDFKSS